MWPYPDPGDHFLKKIKSILPEDAYKSTISEDASTRYTFSGQMAFEKNFFF